MTLEELKMKEGEIADVCRVHGIARLDVFGSVVRQEATENSDVDLLVKLHPSPEKTYVRLEKIAMAFTGIIPAQPDLLLEERITNPYVRRAVERERLNLYGA